VLKWSVI